MTISRGPWIGCVLALCIAYMGRAKNLVRSSLIVGGLLIVAGVPAYIAGAQYMNAPAQTEDQTSVLYRQTLIPNYMPIARYGGAWGWGHSFPTIYRQTSIDNEYLLVDLIQGYIGLATFLLLAGEAGYRLLKAGLEAQSLRDRHFAFSLLGVLAGLLLILATVFLGNQSCNLFFLLLGWSQAIRVNEQPFPQPARYRKVGATPPLTRVYT
jgi:hypothetical protein